MIAILRAGMPEEQTDLTDGLRAWIENVERQLARARAELEREAKQYEPHPCRRCGVSIVRAWKNRGAHGMIAFDATPAPGGPGYSDRIAKGQADYVYAHDRKKTELLYRPHKCKKADIERRREERAAEWAKGSPCLKCNQAVQSVVANNRRVFVNHDHPDGGLCPGAGTYVNPPNQGAVPCPSS